MVEVVAVAEPRVAERLLREEHLQRLEHLRLAEQHLLHPLPLRLP